MSIAAGDGRVLEVALAGPPDGEALFSHHGTPGAALMFEPQVKIGAEGNLRHITYSPPGYGGSTRAKGRSVATCVADVAENPVKNVSGSCRRRTGSAQIQRPDVIQPHPH